MTRRHAGRAASDGQLLFDWNAQNTNDNQPLTVQPAHAASALPGIDDAPFPLPVPADETNANAMDDHGYGPGHPWHYLPDGDNAPPIPFDDIPPAEDYGHSLERELPKPAAKRIIKARGLLAEERRDLEQARARYDDVIARGAAALSRYDREIAYGGNDELARAGTLALLYSQISWRRGRIAYLERMVLQGFGRHR
ncbi:MAG: hypothetical protein HUU22_02105 [Phycisphaerae bacterium]|nr:hypothetical protein [Phycisphaerae bacterium]NUQ44808.1 hypothetical protein [Phycisphaerae bacterium]